MVKDIIGPLFCRQTALLLRTLYTQNALNIAAEHRTEC